MSIKHPVKNPVPQDWHVADIKCALEKKGWSLSRLSKKNGLCRSACKVALYLPAPKAERIIAAAIGVPPQTIWPSRWNWNGTGQRRPRGRPKRNANTAGAPGVIQPSGAV